MEIGRGISSKLIPNTSLTDKILKVTAIYHELTHIYEYYAPCKPGIGGRPTLYRRVTMSDRYTDIPPNVSPFPVMVSSVWRQEAIEMKCFSEYLELWDQNGNPPGFDTVPEWRPLPQLPKLSDDVLAELWSQYVGMIEKESDGSEEEE